MRINRKENIEIERNPASRASDGWSGFQEHLFKNSRSTKSICSILYESNDFGLPLCQRSCHPLSTSPENVENIGEEVIIGILTPFISILFEPMLDPMS